MLTKMALLFPLVPLHVAKELEDSSEFAKKYWDLIHQVIPQSMAVPMVSDAYHMLHMCSQWRSYGMPILELTPTLFSHLLLTDPSRVDPSVIKTPFRTFVIVLPKKTGWMIKGSTSKLDTPVRCIFVNHCKTLSGFRLMRMHAMSDCSNAELGIFDNSYEIMSDTDMSFWLKHKETSNQSMFAMTEEENLMLLAMRRLVVNVALYSTTRGLGKPESPPNHHKAGFKKRTKNESPWKNKPKTWVLGRDIGVSAEVDEHAGNVLSGKASISDQTYIVSGHWKNQRHGPKRTLIKTIWVKPYWRGALRDYFNESSREDKELSKQIIESAKEA